MVRLELLRLNTMGALDPAVLADKRPATPFAVEMGRQLRCVISGPAAG
jgi:hypothetical protein